jgi:hypothetical protein
MKYNVKMFREKTIYGIAVLFFFVLAVDGSEKATNKKHTLGVMSEPLIQIIFNYLDIRDLKTIFFFNRLMMQRIHTYFKFHFHVLQEFCLQLELSSIGDSIPVRSLWFLQYFPRFER